MVEVKTKSGEWAGFCEQIVSFLHQDLINLLIDGEVVVGFRSPDCPALWIRDHSDIMRSGKYVIRDPKSAVDAFASTQHANGRLFDFVTHIPLGADGEQENWEKWVRVPVEADVEYRFVKAAYLAWQATGDDDWISDLLPNMEMAIRYSTTHPLRWDEHSQLVKRPYTIDTWDFDFTAGRLPWLNFQVSNDTYWGIMHGDNSGVYEAAQILSSLYRRFTYQDKANRWAEFAAGLRARANELLFNGSFYRHFHKLTPVEIPGVDEERQLSLSNPMAINRGLATHDRAVAILDEYARRRAESDSFAEWYSIDPPFPDGIFGDEKLVAGAYCNGGIMPLVGGDLALAAFEHGREAYGLQTLKQYRDMIATAGATYLWYFPDGRASTVENSTSPDAQPTDGWGSSAMLNAFAEGLAGVRDLDSGFRHVHLAPRWILDDESDVWVRMTYEASRARFSYHWRHDIAGRRIRLEIETAQSDVDLHLMLPEGTSPKKVVWAGRETTHALVDVEGSRYVDASGTVTRNTEVVVEYTRATGDGV